MMPGMNRKGPRGLGPMTGRGLGICAAGIYALRYGGRALRSPGWAPGIRKGFGLAPVFRSGFGRMLGRGLGCGWAMGIGYVCMRGLRKQMSGNARTEKEIEPSPGSRKSE